MVKFKPIGQCERCQTTTIKLSAYRNMKLCDFCKDTMIKKFSPILRNHQKEYQDLLDLFNRTQ